MIDSAQIKAWMGGRLPLQVRQWLWQRKVAWGNARIRALQQHLSKRIHEVWLRDLALFDSLETRADWEHFRDERIAALHHSLRMHEADVHLPNHLITRTLERNKVRIDNIVFEGHRNIPVTANMYKPIRSIARTPAIILCHSHHAPKTEIELQCMGQTWAQQGCTVLILDLLGHGERRQHPFVTDSDYKGSFRLDRQDYYYRYVLGMQLGLIDETLMGWMVHDVRRGINLLCTDPQVDQRKMIVIGSVAGGGDLSAIVGALDKRISAVVSFNYGHLSMGDWDSTRNLPNTTRYGFWPWLILASLAPRRLIYAREFSWNVEDDPVWKCLKKIYDFYESPHSLRSIHGSGHGTSQGPMDSHCTNVGSVHRAQLYPILGEWFGIPAPEREHVGSVEGRELECWTEDAARTFSDRRVQEVAQEICQNLLNTARERRASQSQSKRLSLLQPELIAILGPMTPFVTWRVRSRRKGIGRSEHVVLEVGAHVILRLNILWPPDSEVMNPPVVIGFTQEGNRRLRTERRPLIQCLLSQGMVVCLTEFRGIGDGRVGELYRGRISPSAGIAITTHMFGENVLCSRVRDLRTVMAYLSTRQDLDSSRVGLWGDSLAKVNPEDRDLVVPLDAVRIPEQGESLGGTVALLTALYESHIRVVYARGSLISYASLLDEPFVYHPTDSVMRGLLCTADLSDLAAALSPLPLRMERLVDGANRLVSQEVVQKAYRLTRAAYDVHNNHDRLLLEVEPGSVNDISIWMNSFLQIE